MSKHWREPLDPKRHVDHHFAGGPRPREAETGEAYAYFVEVCRFTFELASLEQIEACVAFFERRIQPSSSLVRDFQGSSKLPVCQLEKGHYERWHERFPARILKGSKRDRIVRALQRALVEFRNAT